MTQSVTDMYNCTHGPKKDCHACLVGELVAALRESLEDCYALNEFGASCKQCQQHERLIAKAKSLDDCVPIEDVREVHG